MTIQQAIRQARSDMAWHVTPGGTCTATVRYLDFGQARQVTEFTLLTPDKEQELVRTWLDRHDSLGAAVDSVLSVSTPKPFGLH